MVGHAPSALRMLSFLVSTFSGYVLDLEISDRFGATQNTLRNFGNISVIFSQAIFNCSGTSYRAENSAANMAKPRINANVWTRHPGDSLPPDTDSGRKVVRWIRKCLILRFVSRRRMPSSFPARKATFFRPLAFFFPHFGNDF